MPLHLRSAHPDETAAIGRSIAALLVPGDVVVLTGPLGAGKTRLVQGIAEGLGPFVDYLAGAGCGDLRFGFADFDDVRGD